MSKIRKSVHRHQGYFMRSYAEVRWSQIMDALGIHWLYEPEPVITRYGMYLPDFLLPLAGMALEVKGAAPSFIEFEKAQDASRQLNMPVVIVYGDAATHGLSVVNAFVLVVYGKLRIGFSMTDLAELVRTNTEHSTWAQLMKACAKHKYNPVRDFREALDEVLIGGGTESNGLRRNAASIENERRSAKQASQGVIEGALSRFSERLAGRASGATA